MNTHEVALIEALRAFLEATPDPEGENFAVTLAVRLKEVLSEPAGGET